MRNRKTEQEWAERFDQDVQTLLSSGGLTSQNHIDLPQDYQEALVVAQHLGETEVAHLSRVRYSLRQKLTRTVDRREVWTNAQQQGIHPMKTSLFDKLPARSVVIVLAFLAVTISLSLTIQPVGALASQILGKVGLFNFTNEQAIPDEWIGQKNFNNVSDATPMPVKDLRGISKEEAERQAGFALLTPSYLPDCFTLNTRSILIDQATPTVTTVYLCHGQTIYDDVFLYMNQSRPGNEPKFDFQIGDAQPVEVVVRGYEGLWIEQAPIGVTTNREGATELMPVNMLVWEEDGFYFQLQSNQLAKEEMMKVAEALE